MRFAIISILFLTSYLINSIYTINFDIQLSVGVCDDRDATCLNETYERIAKHAKPNRNTWKNPVNFHIDSSVELINKREIKQIINYLMQHTCVKFVDQIPAKRGWIVFNSYKTGCYTEDYGYGGIREHVITIFSCDELTKVMHVVLHTLGFPDEVNLPIRDEYLYVNYPNIKKNDRYNFLILNKYPAWIPYVPSRFPFDSLSIMNYGFRAFAIDNRLPVVFPLKKDMNPSVLNTIDSEVKYLSKIDIDKLNAVFCPLGLATGWENI